MSDNIHTVCTSGRLSCEVRRAWEKVCFYEHIATQPTFLLRTILPVPQRTSGAYRKVGDVSRCMYSDGGYLTKKIAHIVEGERIDFNIIEQSIRYANSILLRGGTIQIESHADDTCSVRMLTRYEVKGGARLVPRFFINYVVSAMHKIVIKDMQARLVRSPAPTLPSVLSFDAGAQSHALPTPQTQNAAYASSNAPMGSRLSK